LNYDAVGNLASGTARGQGRWIPDLLAVGNLQFRLADLCRVLGRQGPAIRLDTAYTYADVNSLRRYTAGDFVESSLSWTRPVRLEGAQLRLDFSTRPDLITFPMPAVGGQTAVPSTVTVLANGSQVFYKPGGGRTVSDPATAGHHGANTLSMTVTNALGQQVTVSQPFYAASTLLAPGLQTLRGAGRGLVRRNWGIESNDDGSWPAMPFTAAA